jgi:hypothetical protein
MREMSTEPRDTDRETVTTGVPSPPGRSPAADTLFSIGPVEARTTAAAVANRAVLLTGTP